MYSLNSPEVDAEFVKLSLRRSNLHLYPVRKSLLDALRSALPAFKGTVLDIGCGYQPYRKIIEGQAGVEKYVGLDIPNPFYPAPDVSWDGKRMPFESGSADTALLMEVLEHCAEPAPLLTETRRVLKPGGLVYFTVPFIFPLHLMPDDYHRYTPASLERLLSCAGFSDIVIRPLGGWDAALAQMLGLWAALRPMTPGKRRLAAFFVLPFIRFLLKKDLLPRKLQENTMFSGLWGTARSR